MNCTKFEKKIIDFIKAHLNLFFLFAITLLGCYMRFSGRWFISNDARGAFIPWFETIKANGGLSGLSTPVGDYGIPFQIIIAFLTYLPFEPLYCYKMLFIGFDFFLAFVTGLSAYECTNHKNSSFIIGFTAVMLSPNVVMNSSIWAQCDSMYVSFLILCFYFILKKKYTWVFITFSLAFAIKLQAIFFIPILLLLYFSKKSYSLLNFLLLPITLYITSFISVFYGRNVIKETLDIYTHQVKMFNKMYLNYPSIWALFGDGKNGKYIEMMALGLTLGIFACALYLILKTGRKEFTHKVLCLLTLWTTWTCVLFLPSMHDRYGYIIDILTIILAIIDIKYIWYAVAHNFVSTMSYVRHLFSYKFMDRGFLSIINIVFWILLTIHIIHVIKIQEELKVD